MANPLYATLTSVSCSQTINMDYRRFPMNAAVAVTGSSSGTFTYAVLFTLDDQQFLTNLAGSSSLALRAPVFFPDANLNGASSNGTTNYMFPVAGVRLSVTAISSAVVTMCVIQGG
jgi:hypothetical protein